MHELSIAMSIVEMASEEAERHAPERVTAVHLKLGQLSGVVKEALLSAFELAREQSPLAECALVIDEVPITVACCRCGVERPVVSWQEFRCAICGEPAEDIVHGRELEVSALELQP
ncbi:MAG TPA: hydrogenase maturation nickel metallochaperone HypA [Pirellulales bacterium]|jgi:hydrogenase nickel incorporation protein HypA/HybF|nr:hydrogenase maturation nickel metallochaperone HypA [Pirellulales bacterium]